MEFFKDVIVEGGPTHYAEKYDHDSFLKMPYNAIVNFGYIICGVYWYMRVSKRSYRMNRFFYLFSLMACIYGPIQFMRIVTQDRFWGILDQWFTLPFFAVVIAWSIQFNLHFTSFFFTLSIMLLSVASYLGAVYHPLGFEFALGAHILFAVLGTSFMIKNAPKTLKSKATIQFFYAITACSAFVVLKVLDHHLAAQHPVFHIISGHFLSKLGDIGQIHFVLKFFEVFCRDNKTKSS